MMIKTLRTLSENTEENLCHNYRMTLRNNISQPTSLQLHDMIHLQAEYGYATFVISSTDED